MLNLLLVLDNAARVVCQNILFYYYFLSFFSFLFFFFFLGRVFGLISDVPFKGWRQWPLARVFFFFSFFFFHSYEVLGRVFGLLG